MSEELRGVSDYEPRPARLAPIPIDETEQRQFAKNVNYWSGAADIEEASRAADLSEAVTSEYMRRQTPHRPVNDIVQERTRTSVGMKHERGGVTVICKSTDDHASLVVEKRVPQSGELVDRVTRVEYVVDGLDATGLGGTTDDEIDDPLAGIVGGLSEEGLISDVVEKSWLVDRATGKQVEAAPVADDDDGFTFDKRLDVEQRDDVLDVGHTAVIAVAQGTQGSPVFTHARLWQTEDIFAQLAEDGWARSPIERKAAQRHPQDDS